jgi:hypothetical protein
MIARLIRSTVFLAVGRYIWRNRSQIASRARRLRR